MKIFKVSVIVPAYNGEENLARCVDSLINQKWNGNILEDIEIILVDDCSKDNTKQIMDQYSEKYSNIKVYSTDKNIGTPSVARNMGIKMSNSEYIMFLDVDDEYCEDMCQMLYDTITQENVDVVTCNWYSINSISGTGPYKFKFNNDSNDKYVTFSPSEAILNSISSNDWMIWKLIYKKSMLIDNNILFPLSLCEDTFFLFDVYLNMNQMIYINDYYGVKKHIEKDSLTTLLDPENIINYLKYYAELDDSIYAWCNSKNVEYRFNFFKSNLNSNLNRIVLLDNMEDIKNCLNKLREFETGIQFDNSMIVNSINDRIMKIINHFVLKNNMTLAMFWVILTKIALKLKIHEMFKKIGV
jgi:glycosyltransferase involved in cell wall biosynthesis